MPPASFSLQRSLMLLCAALAVAGCAKPKTSGPVARAGVDAPPVSERWIRLANDADEQRIETLGRAWTEALEEARKANPRDVRAEGRLLAPDAALPRPEPTPGSYNCRLVKLGRAKPGTPAFEKFRPFFCYVDVEGDLLTIVKQTGSERPAGRLWQDDQPERLIFLGSMTMGAETKVLAYGDDPKRDMIGVVERIAPFRWRLVIPWPQGNSKLDVFELTPVEKQPE